MVNEIKEIITYWINYTQVHEIKGFLILVIVVFAIRGIVGFFLQTGTINNKLNEIIKLLKESNKSDPHKGI